MRLVKDSAYTFASMLIPTVVSIVAIPLFLSQIGPERYGALAISWLLLGYFGQADFGMGRAVNQRISTIRHTSPERLPAVVMSALLSILGIGLVSALIVFLLADYFFSGPFSIEEQLREELLRSVWALALCTPLVALLGVAAGALMGMEKFRLAAVGNLVSNLGSTLLPLFAAYFFSVDLTTLIVAALLGRLTGLFLIGFGVWRTFLAGQKLQPSGEETRRLFGFGAWIMVSALVGPFMVMADRLIIGYVLGAVAVAAYTIPFQIAIRSQMIPLAVAQALFPRFAAEDCVRARERCLQYTAFIGQIFTPVAISVICLAAPLLNLWLGDNLDQRSIAIAQILMVGFSINAVAQVPFGYIQARGNPRFTAILHVAELPIYFSILYLLGTQFGLPGIAAAFSLRCTLDFVSLAAKAGLTGAYLPTRLAGPAALIGASLFVANTVQSWLALFSFACLLVSLSAVIALLQMPIEIRNRLWASPLGRYASGIRYLSQLRP